MVQCRVTGLGGFDLNIKTPRPGVVPGVVGDDFAASLATSIDAGETLNPKPYTLNPKP